jgi:2-oxoglutarate dehydrogenase E1 component
VIFCTGKVFYDLAAQRQERGAEDTAILRVEQLYPFHRDMIKAMTGQYKNASKFIWCQEEPVNMGAWFFIRPRMEHTLGINLIYAGRESASSPAAGSKAMHYREHKALLEQAFTL